MNRLRFCVNDRWVELSDVPPTMTVLRYLRDRAGLTGTKEGCAEGDCGACTVAVVEESLEGRAAYRAINACLLLLPMVQGKRLYTVEALKDGERHHPVQRALAEALGSQCGYCTPGVVMAMFEACYGPGLNEPWEVDAAMCGNLCRCTGYRPIREATEKIAGLRPADRFTDALSAAGAPRGLAYAFGDQRFFNPTSLPELWDLLDANPGARLIAGGTDLALEVTKRYTEPPLLVALEGVRELESLTVEAGALHIGARVDLSRLEALAQTASVPLARMLRYFGARQIKNRATVGGNLCTASPIGDLAPVLLALDATLVLASRQGERRVGIDQFFLGYRKTALQPNEILARVELPSPPTTLRAASFKVSKRRELDISTVSAAFAVELDDQKLVRVARLAFGGMAATPSRAHGLEAALVGKVWSAEVLDAALPVLEQDFAPLSDHRGSATYRRLVARNLVRGFFEETQEVPVPALPHPHTATAQVGGPARPS
jgi:xanthine dehydrogenase small subunit